MNIKPEDFVKTLETQATEIQELMTEIPRIVGVEAVNHFTENFQHEGFDEPKTWQEVKRREAPKRPELAGASRPILTGETGNLGRSIQYEENADGVTVFSDVEYAEAHNEGTTTAGRNRNITIPQRQFIGDSDKLNEKIEKEINDRINKILNK
jgi:phage gpG-like protein